MYICTSLAEHATGHLYKEGVMTKMGGAMDLMVYTQHHCWILFSSLCLTVARTINNSVTTNNGKGGRRERGGEREGGRRGRKRNGERERERLPFNHLQEQRLQSSI